VEGEFRMVKGWKDYYLKLSEGVWQ